MTPTHSGGGGARTIVAMFTIVLTKWRPETQFSQRFEWVFKLYNRLAIKHIHKFRGGSARNPQLHVCFSVLAGWIVSHISMWMNYDWAARNSVANCCVVVRRRGWLPFLTRSVLVSLRYSYYLLLMLLLLLLLLLFPFVLMMWWCCCTACKYLLFCSKPIAKVYEWSERSVINRDEQIASSFLPIAKLD